MGNLTHISKLFLVGGQDLQLTKNAFVRHPTVADVLALDGGIMCEELYWAYVSTMLSDPYEHMVYLDDRHIDYETVTAWDVFVMRWLDAKQEYLQRRQWYDEHGFSPLSFILAALRCFFGQRNFDIKTYNAQAFLVDLNDEEFVLDGNAFEVANEFIAAMHCIDTSGRIKPSSDAAKRILIEDTRAEQKRQAKRRNKSDQDERPEQLADALQTVLACGAGTITPNNYCDVHIYQLLSTARAIQKQVIVQSMFNGIYTGMLKTDGLSDKDLRWV